MTSPYVRTSGSLLALTDRGARAWGTGDVNALFGDAPTAPAPWMNAPRFKNRPLYDKHLVHQAISEPEPQLADIDPRALFATQPNLVKGGVNHYLTNTDTTFAEPHNAGNRHPVVYTNIKGQSILLSGHHRAAAALLRGQPLKAIHVQERPLVTSFVRNALTQNELEDLFNNPTPSYDEPAYEPSPQNRQQDALYRLRGEGYQGNFEQAARASFTDHVKQHFDHAHDVTQGYLLNPKGKAKNVDPKSLFIGPESRAHQYASEELIDHWRTTPRPRYDEYRSSLLNGTHKPSLNRAVAFVRTAEDFVDIPTSLHNHIKQYHAKYGEEASHRPGPITLYHGTSPDLVPSIQTNGFNPSPSGESGRGLYVTPDPEVARLYGKHLISHTIDPGRLLDLNSPHGEQIHDDTMQLSIMLNRQNPAPDEYGRRAKVHQDILKGLGYQGVRQAREPGHPDKAEAHHEIALFDPSRFAPNLTPNEQHMPVKAYVRYLSSLHSPTRQRIPSRAYNQEVIEPNGTLTGAEALTFSHFPQVRGISASFRDLKAFVPQEFSPSQLTFHYDPSDKHLGLDTVHAKHNGKVVGTAQFQDHHSHEDDTPRGMISWMEVHPDYRQKGVTTALLGFAKDHLGIPVAASPFTTADGEAYFNSDSWRKMQSSNDSHLTLRLAKPALTCDDSRVSPGEYLNVSRSSSAYMRHVDTQQISTIAFVRDMKADNGSHPKATGSPKIGKRIPSHYVSAIESVGKGSKVSPIVRSVKGSKESQDTSKVDLYRVPVLGSPVGPILGNPYVRVSSGSGIKLSVVKTAVDPHLGAEYGDLPSRHQGNIAKAQQLWEGRGIEGVYDGSMHPNYVAGGGDWLSFSGARSARQQAHHLIGKPVTPGAFPDPHLDVETDHGQGADDIEHADNAYALMHGIHHAAPNDHDSYRGVDAEDPDAFVAGIQPGHEFDQPLWSFIGDKQTADSFGDGVTFHLPPGTKGVHGEQFTSSDPSGREFVTGGKFRVSHIEDGPWGYRANGAHNRSKIVHLTQLHTHDPEAAASQHIQKTAAFVRTACDPEQDWESEGGSPKPEKPSFVRTSMGQWSPKEGENLTFDHYQLSTLMHRFHAYMNGKSVGYMDINHDHMYPDEPEKAWNTPGEIQGIEVHPNYRRRGIGTALIDYAVGQGFSPSHSSSLTPKGKAFTKGTPQIPSVDRPKDFLPQNEYAHLYPSRKTKTFSYVRTAVDWYAEQAKLPKYHPDRKELNFTHKVINAPDSMYHGYHKIKAYVGHQTLEAGTMLIAPDRGHMGNDHGPNEIADVMVHPDHRGKGLARAMAQHAQSLDIWPKHSDTRTPDGDAFAKATPELGFVKKKAFVRRAVRWDPTKLPINFSISPNPTAAWDVVKAHHGETGEQLGYMALEHNAQGNWPAGTIRYVEVGEKWKGNGIARALGEHAISQGIQPYHSPLLSPEGREFAKSVPEWPSASHTPKPLRSNLSFVRSVSPPDPPKLVRGATRGLEAATWDGSRGNLTFQYSPPGWMPENRPGSSASEDDHNLDAYVNGQHAGFMDLDPGEHPLINMVKITNPKMKGKGIGRAMAEHFRDQIGIEPMHSGIYSQDGQGFAAATPEFPTYDWVRGKVRKGVPKMTPKSPPQEQISMF